MAKLFWRRVSTTVCNNLLGDVRAPFMGIYWDVKTGNKPPLELQLHVKMGRMLDVIKLIHTELNEMS